MIGKLKGLLDSQGEDFLILDVHGVGFIIQCSNRTLQNLPETGTPLSLLIETQVREDSIKLFGFTSAAERDWFRLLQNVQGVGSKVALAILGILLPPDLAQAIAAQDKLMISRAPGVGPKLAARILAELKDKVPAFAESDNAPARLAAFGFGERSSAVPLAAADAIAALVNLGYARPQAASAVAAAISALGEAAAAGELIRRGLKELSNQ